MRMSGPVIWMTNGFKESGGVRPTASPSARAATCARVIRQYSQEWPWRTGEVAHRARVGEELAFRMHVRTPTRTPRAHTLTSRCSAVPVMSACRYTAEKGARAFGNRRPARVTAYAIALAAAPSCPPAAASLRAADRASSATAGKRKYR
eukprot:scaffold4229_cov30-Tisochrysis_lutea.AAC.14